MSNFLNHRLSSRTPVTIPTQIYHQNDNSRSATITDLSQEGAYTLLDDAKQLPIDDIVKIKFTLTENNETHHLLLPAIIIHHETKGLGIMFINENQELCQVLNSMTSPYPHASELKESGSDGAKIIPIKINSQLKPIEKNLFIKAQKY